MKLKHGRGKRYTSAMGLNLKWQNERTARQIAQDIRALAAGPEMYCEDPACPGRQKYLAFMACVFLALERAAGRSPDITPEPPCSAAVLAAEAKLGAPR